MLMAVAGLAVADNAPPQPHNILLIIADDVGADMIGAYQPLVGSQSVPQTPTIDGLATQGILFRNVWVNPLCAATRAALQTGRYGFRTGVQDATGTLPVKEFSIGKVLHRDPANHHALALFGKWGLAGAPGLTQPDPVQMGYDEYKGVLAPGIPAGETYSNFTEYSISFHEGSGCDQHDPASYASATCVSSLAPQTPASQVVTTYATTKNADDTIAWINGIHNQSGGTRPWFVTLAFNAAHTPLNAPPAGLIHGANCSTYVSGTNGPSCYRAMVEAMDSEIQRVLANIPQAELDRTTIIFMGDNGSAQGMAVSPFDGAKAKATVYEGGVHVPFIVAGSDVAAKGRISNALVNATDVFMTILDLAGFDHSHLPTQIDAQTPWLHDSVSLLPILQDPCTTGCQIQTMRQFAYTGVNSQNPTATASAVRDFAGYKLIWSLSEGVVWKFYNLAVDPYEQNNLVSASGNLLAGVTDPNAAQALAKLKPMFGTNPLALIITHQPPPIPAVNSPSADPAAHTGDISRDGKVDVTDAWLLLQHLIKAQTLTAAEMARADIYPMWAGDGQLTISDWLALQKLVLSH